MNRQKMMFHEDMKINVSLYYSFNDCMKVNQNNDLKNVSIFVNPCYIMFY
jgi:hypothetical protein